jgi:hypothetical protein
VNAPKPSLSALLVCDLVIEDKLTHNKSIIGTFTTIWAPSFPCLHAKMGIYFCLTDADGHYDLELRLVLTDKEQMLAQAGLSVEIVDRLSINDFGINLQMVPLPKPGRYEIQLFANKQFLGRKEFQVTGGPSS